MVFRRHSLHATVHLESWLQIACLLEQRKLSDMTVPSKGVGAFVTGIFDPHHGQACATSAGPHSFKLLQLYLKLVYFRRSQ